MSLEVSSLEGFVSQKSAVRESFVSLEASSRGGFGVSRQGWERLCEFSSEESGKSVDVEARSRGESKRPVVG